MGILLANCSFQENGNDLLSEKIRIQLDSLMALSKIEALSVGITIDGKIYKYHKGKLLDGNPPTDDTLWEIASLTKTFTGTLLAHAVADNKLKLEDEITTYIHDSFPNLEFEGHPITFKHLVTHQSGLPRMFPNQKGLFDGTFTNDLPIKINQLQQNFSKTAFFQELKRVKLDTIPGNQFNYSNAGANLLGYILEDLYQQTYEELLQEKILQPLQMNQTFINRTPSILSRTAAGQNDRKVKMPFFASKQMSAEGGLISSVDDMIRYMQFHLQEANEVIALSHQELWKGKFGNFEAGLFWQILKDKEKPNTIFQNGGAFGTSSWMTLIPEKKIGIFMVTNVAAPNVHNYLNETVEKVVSLIEVV